MKPLFLKLENFFSHKQSEIDFRQFDSALLLGSIEGDYSKSNGSGKSAVFEAILWCLFNKSRAYQMDDVVHWGELKCEVTFEFLHEQKNYMVKRTRFSATSTSSVEFAFMGEDGKWISLSGSTSGDTNEKICSTIKLDYKTFVNSAYFRQNDISEFSTSDASRKKEILKSIVDISKWDAFEKESKKKLRTAQNELTLAQSTIDIISQEISSLEPYENKKESLSKKLQEERVEHQSLNEEISILSASYASKKSNIDTDSWDRISSEIDSLKKDLIKRKDSYSTIKEDLSSKQAKLDDLTAKINSIESKVKSHDIDPNLLEKIDGMKTELANYKSIVVSCKEKERELSKLEFKKGECYVCNSAINDEQWDSIELAHKTKVDFNNSKLENAKSRISFLEKENKDLVSQKNIKEELNKLSAELPILLFKKDALSREIESLLEKKKLEYAELLRIKEKISEDEKIISSLRDEDFKNIANRLKEAKEKHKNLNDSIMDKSIELGILTEKSSSLSIKRASLKEARETLSKKQDSVSIFEKLTKMLGKNGIQAILLNAVISDLESKSNKILESISEDSIKISLETQRKGSDGISIVDTLDLNVNKDGVVCNFNSLSGGEQFRIALALRIALSEIASDHGGSSLEFLLLDEVSSPLDKSGVETLFVSVIKVLESKYKMLVITHDDSLKERFDNIIEVQKINGESTTLFTTR
jgi:DNA repair exonuclease SbcCD ATPase subunit